MPVHCCWNGMAALRAAPFVQHGLRFRAGTEVDGEVGDRGQVVSVGNGLKQVRADCVWGFMAWLKE